MKPFRTSLNSQEIFDVDGVRREQSSNLYTACDYVLTEQFEKDMQTIQQKTETIDIPTNVVYTETNNCFVPNETFFQYYVSGATFDYIKDEWTKLRSCSTELEADISKILGLPILPLEHRRILNRVILLLMYPHILLRLRDEPLSEIYDKRLNELLFVMFSNAFDKVLEKQLYPLLYRNKQRLLSKYGAKTEMLLKEVILLSTVLSYELSISSITQYQIPALSTQSQTFTTLQIALNLQQAIEEEDTTSVLKVMENSIILEKLGKPVAFENIGDSVVYNSYVSLIEDRIKELIKMLKETDEITIESLKIVDNTLSEQLSLENVTEKDIENYVTKTHIDYIEIPATTEITPTTELPKTKYKLSITINLEASADELADRLYEILKRLNFKISNINIVEE